MALLSKPYKISMRLIGSYISQLYMNPVRTKSISSCMLGALGNYVSQRMAGNKLIDHDTLWAFAIFGVLFGGSIPHYFYEAMSNFLDENSRNSLLQLLLIERLIFMPVYSFFSLYMLSRLELKNHEDAVDNASTLFPSIVEANLKYLTLLQFINIYFVPPILRVIVSNIIGFFWVIFLSRKKQLAAIKKGKSST